MRYFIIIGFAAFLVVGCNRAPQNAGAAALCVWRSPDSTLEQRVKAATELIPNTGGIDEIKAVLGEQGHLSHHYGPTVGREKEGDTTIEHHGYHDYWTFEYEFRDGAVVSLQFNTNTSSWEPRGSRRINLVPGIPEFFDFGDRVASVIMWTNTNTSSLEPQGAH